MDKEGLIAPLRGPVVMSYGFKGPDLGIMAQVSYCYMGHGLKKITFLFSLSFLSCVFSSLISVSAFGRMHGHWPQHPHCACRRL